MARKSFEEIMRAAGAAAAKLRRDHLPGPVAETAIQPGEELSSADGDRTISVRLGEADLRFLDRWIATQPGTRLSRPAAIRQLVAEALARK